MPSEDPTIFPPPGETAPTSPQPPSAIGVTPAAIGRYRIIRVLGQGGMGTVYEAEQEQPRRTVALKVIRAGYLSSELLRRFEHESQVLGRLQHPGIAQVYEAGTVLGEGGQPVPFFAMEFIKGVALTEYATQKNLGTRERLDLLAKVCDAVYHAHQKGVIHRDLKPGNILVDESGQPKILDFGVARATDSDIQQTTIQTDIGQLIGTVPYMSPEQVSGDPSDLDTRSDVYALGVIAYELLAGRLPYDLKQKMIHEAARIIKEEEPTRLSSINRTLRGDVETIVAKALEKEKARRYQSAESLASDIRRYLSDEPITARPASAKYQLAKFAKRNRGLVGGFAAAFAFLSIGLAFALVSRADAIRARIAETAQRVEAVAQRERAEASVLSEKSARKQADTTTAFITKALQSTDPMAKGKRNTTIAEAMANAIKEIDAGTFKETLETESALQNTIGTILRNNGDLVQAQELFERSLATRERLFGDKHPLVAESLINLADLCAAEGQYSRAEPMYDRALAIEQEFYGHGHALVAACLNDLGELYRMQGRGLEPFHPKSNQRAHHQRPRAATARKPRDSSAFHQPRQPQTDATKPSPSTKKPSLAAGFSPKLPDRNGFKPSNLGRQGGSGRSFSG